MKMIVVAFVIALIHGNDATLYIERLSGPPLEGKPLWLKCLSTDPGLDLSRVHFEMRSTLPLRKSLREWQRVSSRLQCLVGENSSDLKFNRISVFDEGHYVCITNNRSISSEPLALKVHYMREVTINPGDPVLVPLGGEVRLECSAVSSETPQYFWRKEGDEAIIWSPTLLLKKVLPNDGGIYTCTAQHPALDSLRKNLSISVMPELGSFWEPLLHRDTRWYRTTERQIVLMSSVVGGALLVLALSIGVFLYCRARSAKGPIDDRSQKKPIYKGSVESLPASACGDVQPLV